MHSCHSCSSIVHRALVTYSNERTGEIRVKIPAVIGNNTEVSISRAGRHKSNNIWVVPSMGEQIVVSADDDNMTNVFWLHTDGMNHTKNYRNYFEAYDSGTNVTNFNVGTSEGLETVIHYDTVVFDEGIRLVDDTKITFDYEGVYNLQYSIQWHNTSTQLQDSVVWIKHNGVNYPDSATYAQVPSSHGGIAGTLVTAINFIGKAQANDYVELGWSATNTDLTIRTVPPTEFTALPNTVPYSPGIIVTVTQVA